MGCQFGEYSSEVGEPSGGCAGRGLTSPYVEICVRICWADSCLTDWNLAVRQRNKTGEGGDSTVWASPAVAGAVGVPSGPTHSGDQASVGASTPNEICSQPESPGGVGDPGCGLSEPLTGEAVCFCVDNSMGASFADPLIFDVVVNFFGADTGCHALKPGGSDLGTMCVQYFCSTDNGPCSNPYTAAITGVNSTTGKGAGGELGLGDYPQPTIVVSFPDCGSVSTSTTSTCWILSAKSKDGRRYIDRGPGRAPDKFILPDSIMLDTVKLVEDGEVVPRGMYFVVHDSVAKKKGLPRTPIFYGARAGRDKTCKKCKKGKRTSLF